jgi:transcriptional regulator with XRE-family HTH domain
MLMGVPRNTVWRWERAAMQPPTTRLLAWVHSLGLSLALLDQDGAIRHLPGGADPAAAARADGAALADILRARRLRLGLIRSEVAQSIGAATNTLRQWEDRNGTPTPGNLDAWCRELGYKITIVIPADHPSLRKPRTAPTAAQLSWAA